LILPSADAIIFIYITPCFRHYFTILIFQHCFRLSLMLPRHAFAMRLPIFFSRLRFASFFSFFDDGCFRRRCHYCAFRRCFRRRRLMMPRRRHDFRATAPLLAELPPPSAAVSLYFHAITAAISPPSDDTP
jgi:hypothetical protein